MKLYETILNRDECLKEYGGYTEFHGDRFTLYNNPKGMTVFHNNAIIFGYEYDANGAETGFTYHMAEHILRPITTAISQFSTFGGYVDAQGTIVEENGMILIYDPEVSPVSLGSIAHKIAETFRQSSVLVIYKTEATFVYA